MGLELEKLMKEVKLMRKLQRDYFRTRLTSDLNSAKVQELKIDALIKDFEKKQLEISL